MPQYIGDEAVRDRKLFIASIVFIVLFLFTMLAVFSPLKKVFLPFVTAAMTCYFLSPLVRLLEKVKIKRKYGSVIVYAVIFSSLAGVIWFFAPKMCAAASEAVEEINKILKDYGIDLFSADSVTKSAEKFYSAGMGAVQTGAALFVGAMSAFYILADKNIKNVLYEIIPNELRASFYILADDTKSAFNSFFRGQILVAAILALMEGLFLATLKIPYAWALGVIGGLLDIIPYVGAFTALIISVLVTWASMPKKVLWVIIGFLIIQQIENNVISPKIAGGSELHPALVILILYVGSFGGFWGILLAVPLACVLKKTVQRLLESII